MRKDRRLFEKETEGMPGKITVRIDWDTFVMRVTNGAMTYIDDAVIQVLLDHVERKYPLWHEWALERSSDIEKFCSYPNTNGQVVIELNMGGEEEDIEELFYEDAMARERAGLYD